MDKIKALLKSRKFWAAVIALALVIVRAYFPNLPFTDEQVSSFVFVVIAFILGTALEDGLRARAQ